MSKVKKTSTNAFNQIFSSTKRPEEIVNKSTPQTVNSSTSQQLNTLTEEKNEIKEENEILENSENVITEAQTDNSQDVNSLTVQQFDSSTTQDVNKSTVTKTNRILKNGKPTKAKTFFLEPEIIEMFKFIKFKEKIDESKYANQILDQFFSQQFGENWRELIKF